MKAIQSRLLSDKRFSDEWVEDCIRYRAEILVGYCAHWCWDWDSLPVDETTPEIASCHCGGDWKFRVVRWLARLMWRMR